VPWHFALWALLAALTQVAMKWIGCSRTAISAQDDASAYRPAKKWANARLVEHRVALGDEVTTDTVVALVHPAAGAIPAPRVARSPMPGYVLRQTERAFVSPGQLLGNVGTPVWR
jgi:predicted deacylase